MSLGVWDPGLQPERTELAWRRTALSLALLSLVSLRLLPAAFGSALWLVPGIVGVVASGPLWWAARRRAVVTNRTLRSPQPHRLPDGRLLLGAAVFASAVGIAGVIVVLSAPTLVL